MNEPANKVRIEDIRKGITESQTNLLSEIWSHQLKTGAGPIVRVMFSQHGTSKVQDTLRPLAGSIVYETEEPQIGSRFAITLLGAFLTKDGQHLQDLLRRFFEFQRTMFKTAPTKAQVSSQELANALNITPEELNLLGRLVALCHISGGAFGTSGGEWSVGAMKEAETFPETGDLSDQVQLWACRYYRPDEPVFLAERRQMLFAAAPTVSNDGDGPTSQQQADTPIDHSNPLKRRYQVFVSSTYSDLQEERKHAIQALLETKCIPSGMELFPAASESQWKIIKRVIDDCDYYIVIVAGKYGSIGKDGKSFTEMEFDYAISKNKSVFAFLHNDTRRLPVEKSEETDQGRRRLAAFSEKVRKNRLCKFWNSPESLGSAIKTTIMYAIETDPKSGWVRASDAPTWPLVTELEQRIAQLESRPKTTDKDPIPSGKDRIEIPTVITWQETDRPGAKWTYATDTKDGFQYTFQWTWDQVLFAIPLQPSQSMTRNGLFRSFSHALATHVRDEIDKRAKAKVFQIGAHLDRDLFDRIVDTLLAKKLLKHAKRPQYILLSSKGLQRRAELKAMRSAAPAQRNEPT